MTDELNSLTQILIRLTLGKGALFPRLIRAHLGGDKEAIRFPLVTMVQVGSMGWVELTCPIRPCS